MANNAGEKFVELVATILNKESPITTMPSVKKIELIDLDSDEDLPKKSGPKKTCNTNCINFQCTSGIEMSIASSYTCSFYGVNMKKKKKRHVCKVCSDVASDHLSKLCNDFENRKPLLNCDFPDHTMEIEISDSEESDSDEIINVEDEQLSEAAANELEKKIDQTLGDIDEKYGIKYQLEESTKIIDKKLDTLDTDLTELDGYLSSIMSTLNTIKTDFYKEFATGVIVTGELTINDDESTIENIPQVPRSVPNRRQNVATKRTGRIQPILPKYPIAILNQPNNHPNQHNLMSNTFKSPLDTLPEILEVKNESKLSSSLPPMGPLVKPIPKVDDVVFTMKNALLPWIKGKIQTISSKNPVQYRVKLLPKKYAGQVKIFTGKFLAASQPSPVMIPVGTRVVAIFHDVNASNYYSGIVAETPKSINKFRYLIFFDDGYAQYVGHSYTYLVCESSPGGWEDVPIDSREFIRKYLESYPERPMVKLQVGQSVRTEWNSKWWMARVAKIDASLVQMHFEADNRTEWIYRGSARLGPLYNALMNANRRQQGMHSGPNPYVRHRVSNTTRKEIPYVEYTSNIIEELRQKSNIAQPTVPQNRAVARKSTAKKPEIMQQSCNSVNTEDSHNIVYFETKHKLPTKKYVRHKCGPTCADNVTFTSEAVRNYPPLSLPILCGWNRQHCKFSKGRKVIFYQTPCGLRLRNMKEVHKYLRITKSLMSVDLFEFSPWVNCLAEFMLNNCFINIKDLSYSAENMPIPCVNELDRNYPDTISYTTKRLPADDVFINTDPDFLCCCDCEDDCQDKEKCQCWQLTIQGASYAGNVSSDKVGYQYKRLREAVATGIYECNTRCKCSVKTCLNRVVQHPLSLKLQVFKTAPRGWGIRCLNDIPQGSFICIYAGRLLTEQGANEGGINYGDEYLAELDYIEVVEGIKEGYESDVMDPELCGDSPEPEDEESLANSEDENRNNNDFLDDDDSEFCVNKKFLNKSIDSTDGEDASRYQLRKRVKKGEKDKEKEKEKEKSEDSTATLEKKDEITIKDPGDKDSDDDETVREPGKLDLVVEATDDNPLSESTRNYFGKDECVYIMDAKNIGNIGRYLNHSCDPNVYVQNVFVDTHDLRFPWVAFFALTFIRAGQELTWNYSYDVGSIPGKVIFCQCGASNCRGRLL